MADVLVASAIIATGWVIEQIDMLVKQPPIVLARLVYYVLAPTLLFTLLAESPIKRLFPLRLAGTLPPAI